MNPLDFLLEPLGQPYVQKALLEMLMLSVVGGVVSCYIVLRGTAFLANALSHAIFPGIVIAFLLGVNAFWGGLAAGLVVVGSVTLTTRSRQVSENSAIGVIYIGAFALGVVLITAFNHVNTSGLESFLFGQLLGVGWEDILTSLIVGSLVLLVIFGLRKELLLASFDEGMARATGIPVGWINLGFLVLVTLTVVTGLPAVGNILMIAVVITPGATARLLTDRLRLMVPLACCAIALSSLAGIVVSYHFGLTPGACVVVALTLLFLLALVYATLKGRAAPARSGRPLTLTNNKP